MNNCCPFMWDINFVPQSREVGMKKNIKKPFHLICLYLIMSSEDFSYDEKVTRKGWVLLLLSQNLYINIYSIIEYFFNAYFIYNLFVYAYAVIILQNTCFFFILLYIHFHIYLISVKFILLWMTKYLRSNFLDLPCTCPTWIFPTLKRKREKSREMGDS